MNERAILIVFSILTLFAYESKSQTVGLFLQSEEAFNGYTLFTPNPSRNTFLIDNCGKEIHRWSSDYTPGLSAYLLEDGNLLRTNRISSSFNGGGSGGRLEMRTWNNQLVWSYNFSNDSYHQHHDIEPMPNGNILVVAWEKVPAAELNQSGRMLVGNNGLWSCYIAEIKPVGSNLIELVWEWRAWDHIIQDVDTALVNYGVISEHPERIDVNLDPGQSADWLHVNGIDYNPNLDQIALSVHDLDEIWIIDHSTTTAEAKGSDGGTYGKGGDLLYRWGNPENYGRGSSADQMLFGQHDVRWIENGLRGEGSLMVFNNGAGRPGPQIYSSVDVWMPPQDSAGFYILEPSEAFGPLIQDEIIGPNAISFYSSRISGAHRLPNGNTLICSGRDGRFMEVDSSGLLVWDYINPISTSVISQGSPPFGNDVFRVTRYGADYAAFDDKELEAGDPLEANPVDYECEIFVATYDYKDSQIIFHLYPNPSSQTVILEVEENMEIWYSVYTIDARKVLSGEGYGKISIDVSSMLSGLYFVRVETKDGRMNASMRFIRN